MQHSSDDIKIGKDTVLKPMIDRLERIHGGWCFISEENEHSQLI